MSTNIKLGRGFMVIPLDEGSTIECVDCEVYYVVAPAEVQIEFEAPPEFEDDSG